VLFSWSRCNINLRRSTFLTILFAWLLGWVSLPLWTHLLDRQHLLLVLRVVVLWPWWRACPGSATLIFLASHPVIVLPTHKKLIHHCSASLLSSHR
jgi:hypothetical protein